MDENERLAKLLEAHKKRVDEMFKGHENHQELLAGCEWMIQDQQRRMKKREEQGGDSSAE